MADDEACEVAQVSREVDHDSVESHSQEHN